MQIFFIIVLCFIFSWCLGMFATKIYCTCDDIRAIRDYIESDKHINLTINKNE